MRIDKEGRVYFKNQVTLDAELRRIFGADGVTEFANDYTEEYIHWEPRISYLMDKLWTDKFDKHYTTASKKVKYARKHLWVKLNSTILKQILGSDYAKILTLLKIVGKIKINPKYVIGEESKKYMLINHDCQFKEYECFDEELNNNLKARDARTYGNFSNTVKQIVDMYPCFTIDESEANNFTENYVSEKMGARSAMRYSITKIATGYYHPSVGQNNGRISSVFTNLKRELCQFIRLDGETLFNVDVSASQPTLLVYHYNLWRECNPDVPPIDDNYLELVLTGKLYEFVVKKLFPGIEDEDQIAELRDDVKLNLIRSFFTHQAAINDMVDRDDEESNQVADIVKIFHRYFPNVFKFMKHVKSKKNDETGKSGNKDFAITLQFMESDLFINKISPILIQNKIKFITKHDAFLVKECDAEFVRRTIKEEFQKHYNIDPIVKINDCREIKEKISLFEHDNIHKQSKNDLVKINDFDWESGVKKTPQKRKKNKFIVDDSDCVIRNKFVVDEYDANQVQIVQSEKMTSEMDLIWSDYQSEGHKNAVIKHAKERIIKFEMDRKMKRKIKREKVKNESGMVMFVGEKKER